MILLLIAAFFIEAHETSNVLIITSNADLKKQYMTDIDNFMLESVTSTRLQVGLATDYSRADMKNFTVVLVDEADFVLSHSMVAENTNKKLRGMVNTVQTPLVICVSATWSVHC